MEITDLIWLDAVVDKIETKHRVTPTEVEEVLHKQTGAGLILSARDMDQKERRSYASK